MKDQKLLDLIDYETVLNIEKGMTIPVNKQYEIYSYTEANQVVLINKETEEEEYCILLGGYGTLMFESLL